MQYFSQAKLLLTGEYLVLAGAKALALPLKFGQSLSINPINTYDILNWHASEYSKTWFEASFKLSKLELTSATDNEIAKRLLKILRAAKDLNPNFLDKKSIQIETDLDFNRHWGLGTSSTLISNIAWWADIDPYNLLWKVSKGSGYDIACAREKKPIIYSVINQQPQHEIVSLNPLLPDKINFVYLGKKQNTQKSIESFNKDASKNRKNVNSINRITELFAKTSSINDASQLIDEHETIIGNILKQKPIKQALFNDFPGVIKSLGAWGGDFIMIISDKDPNFIRKYFNKKGLNIIFRYNDIIIS